MEARNEKAIELSNENISNTLNNENNQHTANNLNAFGLFQLAEGIVSTETPYQKLILLPKLLTAIIDDDQIEVTKILADPKNLILLTHQPDNNLIIKSKMTEQTFVAKAPLPMALMRGGVQMVKLLLTYFEEMTRYDIADGITTALSQWKLPASNSFQINRNEIVLNALIEVIVKESFSNGIGGLPSDATLQALKKFRKTMLSECIDVDFCQNHIEALLITAYQCYDDSFQDFQNEYQRNFFCISVIGLLQSMLPPSLLTTLCDEDVLKNNFNLFDNTPEYPSTSSVRSGLGSKNLIGVAGMPMSGRRGGLLPMADARYCAERLEQLLDERTRELKALQATLKSGNWPRDPEPESSFCVII